MSEKINENNININFTSLIDYIKDKDIEIEHWRFKHLQEFKNRKKIEEKIDKAIEYIKEKISSTQGVINDYMYHKEHNKILIELLQEDIEMYKNELNILNGDKDDMDK